MLRAQHGLAVGGPAHLLVELDPAILHVLHAAEAVARVGGELAPGLEVAGEGAGEGVPQTAEGVGEEDVGDGEVGAEDAAERLEDGHDSEGDAVP